MYSVSGQKLVWVMNCTNIHVLFIKKQHFYKCMMKSYLLILNCLDKIWY